MAVLFISATSGMALHKIYSYIICIYLRASCIKLTFMNLISIFLFFITSFLFFNHCLLKGLYCNEFLSSLSSPTCNRAFESLFFSFWTKILPVSCVTKVQIGFHQRKETFLHLILHFSRCPFLLVFCSLNSLSQITFLVRNKFFLYHSFISISLFFFSWIEIYNDLSN